MLNSFDLAPAPGTFNATRTDNRFGVSHLLKTLGVLLVAALLACGPDTSTSNDRDARARDNNASAHRVLPTPVVRDSAGIRIVEYPSLGPMAPAWAEMPNNPLVFDLADLPPALRLEAQPFLDLGGVHSNEQEEFDASHPMLSATELTNGTIVVNDRTQLKFFTPTGTFIRAVGRKGMGPGEFQQTREVCRLPGDSLLVIDYAGGRLTLWDANGEHVRTYPRTGAFHACHASGALLVQDAAAQTITNHRGDRLGPHALRRPDGTLIRELGMLPVTVAAGGLARAPSVQPVGDELYIGNARLYEVKVQNLEGRVRRITRLTGPLVPITDELWKAHAEAMVPRTASPQQRELLERFTAVKPFQVFPAFSRIRVDPVGRTWIMDFQSQGSWTVLDSSGVIVGRFVVPDAGMFARSQLVGLAANHVVLLQDDADGAMHLRFYRFVEAKQ